MNSRLSLQQFKVLFFVQSLFALLLAATGRASASGIDIKDTNYPIPSDAYYVSPSGSATNNSCNNLASPCSVAKAIQLAPSGATIVFRGGTYRGINSYITKKLTLQPYPHEKAWIKGSLEVTGWVADGTIWRKDNWTYSYPSNVNSVYIDPKYPRAGYRDMVYIDGVSLKQVASKAEVGTGTFYVDSVNKKLYIGNNPAGKTVEATALKEGFGMWKDASSDPSNTVVRGLGFAHYAEQAIVVGAPRVKLENNTFVWNGVNGAFFAPESGGQKNVSIDGIVRGNTFSYNGRKGLGGEHAHRLLVEGNTISYNNVERFSTNYDAAGAKFTRSDGLILRDNLVENNYSSGFWFDLSVTNATIVRNVVRNNLNTGIWFEVSHKGLIGANVVVNNGTGLFILNSSSVRVYNNTLARNKRNIWILDTTRNNTNPAEVAAGITWISRNHVVKNNISSNATGSSFFDASNCEPLEQEAPMIVASDYNAYYRTSSSNPSTVTWWWNGAGKCSVGYPSIAAFNSATGYEAHALAIDNVATNPFFVDEANGNFRLKAGSPAIGRGEPLPPDIAAAVGLPSGVKVDLGALQATVY